MGGAGEGDLDTHPPTTRPRVAGSFCIGRCASLLSCLNICLDTINISNHIHQQVNPQKGVLMIRRKEKDGPFFGHHHIM